MKITFPETPYRIIFLSLLVGLQGCGGKSNSTAVETPTTVSQTNPLIMSDHAEKGSNPLTKRSSPIPYAVTTDANSQQITLTWSAVANANGYTVYWSNALPFEQKNAVADPSNSSTFTHQVMPNTTYYYQVTHWLNGEEQPLQGRITAQSKMKKTSSNRVIVDESR